MSIFSTGQDLWLRQGDTGNISFSGLPTDKAYSMYLSVYNPDDENILKELVATTYAQSTGVAIFTLDENFTNALPVGDWVYGLKLCSEGTEDTILPRTHIVDGKLVHDAAPKFTVAEKYALYKFGAYFFKLALAYRCDRNRF